LRLRGNLSSRRCNYTPIFEHGEVTHDPDAFSGTGIVYANHEYNLGCDMYLVVDVIDHPSIHKLVVFIQCKDWFSEFANNLSMFAHWRWAQQFAISAQVPMNRDGNPPTKILNPLAKFFSDHPSIKPVFLLFSANSFDWPKKPLNYFATTPDEFKTSYLRNDEGLMNLHHMKCWFPTVGYNVEAAAQFRQLWARTDTVGNQHEGSCESHVQ